jgi:serine/threonine transporter
MSIVKKYAETSLVLRIVIGLVLGAILGLFFPELKGISILGQVFVNALKAIAPVLVAILVVGSVAKANGGLGPRFRTVITLYLVTTMIAAIVAVVGSFLFPVSMVLKEGAESDGGPGALVDVFSNLITNMVANPIAAVSNANYLGVLFWAILVGLALKRLAAPATIAAITDFADAMSLVVRWVIQFAPFGIFGLVFTSVSESGMEIFTDYGRLLLLLVGCMLFSSLIINPIIVYLYIRRNPYPLVWTCLKESGINAFFTRSSAANIPINMQLCKKFGLDEKFYSVSIPLGSTINMDGAAVTITVMTLATCHTLGIEVSFLSAVLLSFLSALAACGASGVAGGSLLLIPMACSLFGISNDIAMEAVAVGFIIGVVQDSVETALNSSGDAIFTVTSEWHDRMKKDLKNSTD